MENEKEKIFSKCDSFVAMDVCLFRCNDALELIRKETDIDKFKEHIELLEHFLNSTLKKLSYVKEEVENYKESIS